MLKISSFKTCMKTTFNVLITLIQTLLALTNTTEHTDRKNYD